MERRIDLVDKELAERSFVEFVKQAWGVLEPRTRFLDNWHLHLLAEYLELVVFGAVTRLIINLPPRYGKSLLATIFLPCWVWVRNPAERWLFASYSAALATKHSVDRRTLIRSQWYQSRWGMTVKLADDSNQKTEFSNTARGHQIATSVGASATGRGGNFLLVDDLINPEQANSDTERNGAIRWFDETFSTRLDDKRGGRIVVIEQRTNAADLTGHLLDQGGFTHVSLPAAAEGRTVVIFPRSHREVVREEGDPLWPAREGRPELEAAKLRLGSFAFASQYMQAPVSREGNLFKIEWLTSTYRAAALPLKFDSIVLSLDTAFKTAIANDYSAIVVIGTLHRPRGGFAPGHYLLEAWRGRLEFGELKRKVVELHQTWHSNVVLIEDAASGQSLIQELRAGTSLPIKPIKPDSDKYTRAVAVCPTLEARRLILPEVAWWRDDFIAELTRFPAGAHDDWVDALVQALNHLRVSGEPNVLIFARRSMALTRHSEGWPIDRIAELFNSTSEEVRDWVLKDQQRQAASRNAALAVSEPRCARCQDPVGSEYTQCRGLAYHKTCFNKLLRGE